MKVTQIRQLSIRTLRRMLRERCFAVPKLQREFEWNGKRAAALLDSIYRHMPIGSILVWEAKPESYYLMREAVGILPLFNEDNPHGWFLIDGQQRLSVIHEAFEGEVKENSKGRKIDFSRLCFALDSDRDDGDPAHFVYRRKWYRQFVSVKDVLAADWRRNHKSCTKPLLKRLENCRRRLLGYKVPVVVIHSDDLEEIREVFLRINSLGMKISAADHAFARATKADLRGLAKKLRAELNAGFSDLDLTVVLQSFSFVTPEREFNRTPDVGQRAIEATVKWWERRIDGDGKEGSFARRWREHVTAFGKAVEYLHQHFGVHYSGFLPSQNMLATLTVFFFYHPAAPNARQAREIRKWFWATGVALRYSGRGYHKNLVGDVKFFRRLARSGNARFEFQDRVDRLDVMRAEYTQRSALVNAFFCMLALRKPRFIENGEPIPENTYASRANRRDRHHIFPRGLLVNSGFAHRDYHTICNICFIAGEENKIFGMKRPDSYLADHMKRRHFARAMKSHLIPYDHGSGLWTKDVPKAYSQFRLARLKLICGAFEDEAGIKLFRKG